MPQLSSASWPSSGSQKSTTVRTTSGPNRPSSGMVSRNAAARDEAKLQLARAAVASAFAVSDDLGAQLAVRLFTSPRRHQRPAREASILSSASRFTVDATMHSPRWHGETRQLSAWRWGHGPSVLLVHGWEGRGSQLGALVAPLVDAGLSVVTFDAPGHGDSPGSRLYLTDLGDCVIAMVDAVRRQSGGVHAIVAHSFGATAVLLAHQRGGVDAARNVFLAPNALVDSAVDHFARMLHLDVGEVASFAQRLEADSGVPLEQLALPTLIGQRDSALLVIHDDDDREIAVDRGQLVAATWPGAELVVTHGLGHRRILRDAAVLARVAQFVGEGMPRRAGDLDRALDAAGGSTWVDDIDLSSWSKS